MGLKEGNQRSGHEAHRDPENRNNGHQFWYKSQRHFLNRRQSLKKADNNACNQGNPENRHRRDDGHPQTLPQSIKENGFA